MHTDIKRHGLVGIPQRKDQCWEIIKAYLQHYRIVDPFGASLQNNHWFKTLERLLDCTSSSSPGQSFIVTREEAENLVSLYIIKLKEQEPASWIPAMLDSLSQSGYPCNHLKDFLVEHNLHSERQSVNIYGNAAPRMAISTISAHSPVVAGPTT